jgi:hypothetical protein
MASPAPGRPGPTLRPRLAPPPRPRRSTARPNHISPAATARDRSTSPSSVIAKANIFCTSGFEHTCTTCSTPPFNKLARAPLQPLSAAAQATATSSFLQPSRVHPTLITLQRLLVLSLRVITPSGTERPRRCRRALPMPTRAPTPTPPRHDLLPRPPAVSRPWHRSPRHPWATTLGFAAPLRFKLVSVGGRAHDLLRDAAKGHKTVDIRPSTHRMHGLPAGPPLATATVGQILHGQSDFDDEAAQFRCPCRLSRRDEILPDRPTRRHTTRNREELMALGARELVPDPRAGQPLARPCRNACFVAVPAGRRPTI